MQSCLEMFILPDTLRDNLYSLSISQQVRDLTPQEYDIEFRSLQYALFSSCFFQVLSRWYQTRMLFFFLKLHSDISVWLLRGCIDLITDVQFIQTIFSNFLLRHYIKVEIGEVSRTIAYNVIHHIHPDTKLS